MPERSARLPAAFAAFSLPFSSTAACAAECERHSDLNGKQLDIWRAPDGCPSLGERQSQAKDPLRFTFASAG